MQHMLTTNLKFDDDTAREKGEEDIVRSGQFRLRLCFSHHHQLDCPTASSKILSAISVTVTNNGGFHSYLFHSRLQEVFDRDGLQSIIHQQLLKLSRATSQIENLKLKPIDHFCFIC